MIRVRGKKVYFSGKDAVKFEAIAADLGLSLQNTVTGMLWEHIMRLARDGMFKNLKKRGAKHVK